MNRIDTHTTRTVVAQPQPGPRNQDSLPWRWARVGANLIQWGYTSSLVFIHSIVLYTPKYMYTVNCILYSRRLIHLAYILSTRTPVY